MPAMRIASSFCVRACGVATIVLASMTSVQAGSSSGSLQVTATVLSACVVTGGTLPFGSLDPVTTSGAVNASTTLSVQCSNSTAYTVALDAGLNAGGTANFSSRRLSNGSGTIDYQLYRDSARSIVWGDGTASSSTVTGTGNGSAQSLTVYGRIPALGTAAPGAYTDTVTILVTF